MDDLQRIQALMEQYDLNEHDILCFIGVGSARAAEFGYAECDYTYAEKMHSISKTVDQLLVR